MVRFVGRGGLATFLAPGRGTYGLVRSAAFQGCKDRRKILKWRHMRAFSGSVSEWCGRADAARLLPQQPPSGRAAAARTQAAAAPAAAQRPGSFRLAAGQHPPRGRTDAAVAGRMLGRQLPRQNGCCLGCRLGKRILRGRDRTALMGESVPAEAPRTVEGDVSKFLEIWTETRDADIPGGGMNRKRLMVPKAPVLPHPNTLCLTFCGRLAAAHSYRASLQEGAHARPQGRLLGRSAEEGPPTAPRRPA